MSAEPRRTARERLAEGYYWFNFFNRGLNLFLYIFYSMYSLQFCIFYNPTMRNCRRKILRRMPTWYSSY